VNISLPWQKQEMVSNTTTVYQKSYSVVKTATGSIHQPYAPNQLDAIESVLI